MGFLSRFSGGSAHSQGSPSSSSTTSSSSSSAPKPELTQELPQEDAALPSTSADFLPEFGSKLIGQQQPQGRLYDPYEGISGAVGIGGPGRKAVFQLPEGPEFVFVEEAAVRRRSWSENLQFYTGFGYVAGGSTGFAVGGIKYLQQPVDTGLNSLKLRANRLLNTSGSLGRSFGNACGVLGLYFAVFESYFFHMTDGRVPDPANTMAAGFATAALYRSPRGVRTASVAGVVGAFAGACIAALRTKYPSI